MAVIEIVCIGHIEGEDVRGFTVPIRIGERQHMLPVEGLDPYPADPIRMDAYGLADFMWLYRAKLYRVKQNANLPGEEVALRIKHFAIREEKQLKRMRRDVEAFESFDKALGARRERIPEAVRMFVWQRDEGRCVRCGNRERLEFDHIIPVIEGGSNSERNIQLLCEQCNRSKGRAV